MHMKRSPVGAKGVLGAQNLPTLQENPLTSQMRLPCILGWIASLIMRTDAQQGVGLNIVVGIIGALVAGFLLTPLFGIGTINQSNFSLPSLVVSLLGAIILLAIVNFFRRGTVR